MGVAEDGETIRTEREAGARRLDTGDDGLMGQAVDQVDVDAGDPGRAEPVDCQCRLIVALAAVDGGLDRRIQRLREELAAYEAPIRGL